MHNLARWELVACWIVWAAAFLRVKRASHKTAVIAKAANWGILLQTLSYFLAGARWPPRARWWPLDLIGMLLGPIAVIAVWAAVRHLGRQWRVQAGLYEDHELVRTGPYRIVRHPLYASMLAMYLATALINANWPLGVAGLVLFLVGTEIRVRIEDSLLAGRFGRAVSPVQRGSACLPAVLALTYFSVSMK